MSNDLNLCQFIGRLGKDPEMKYTAGGQAVASFSIACGSKWKDKNTGEQKEATEWVNCAAFGKLAEIIGQYVTKGGQVYIAGRLKTDKYEKEGQARYSTKVIVDTLQMLGSKGGHSERGEPQPQSAPQSSAASFDEFDQNIPF